MTYIPRYTPQLTAFGEQSVAQPNPIFQGSFEYTVDNTELTTNTVTSGGTVTQADAMAVLTSSTTTGSDAMLQSKIHAKYRSGQGGMLRFTAMFTTGVAATEQLAGLADEKGSTAAFKNGYMVGFIGDTFGVHRFSNDAVTSVTSFNKDALDGTGKSGMTIDTTKLNVFEIQFQYLGAGAIRFYVEDPGTGMFILFHEISYANQNTVPSTYNPNFHYTMWVDNKATSSNLILKGVTYAYFIEGLNSFLELHQPQFSTGVVQKTTVTTETAIVTIRNKTTYASKTNFIDILLEGVVASIEAGAANNLGAIRLVKNATLGGSPSYTDINTSDSVVDYDTAGTTVSNGKTLLSIPLAGKNDKLVEKLADLTIILGPGDTLTIAGTSANSATIEASILWKELF